MVRRKLRTGRLLLALLLLLVIVAAFWLLSGPGLTPRRDPDSGQVASDRAVNILVVGNDENPELGLPGRADTIIVAHADLETPSLYFLSVPRDTRVEIDGHGEDKLNHAFAYGGVELLAATVEQYLNIPIDYYAVTNFDGFENIVDVLGGVDIDVDKRMYYQTYDVLIDIEAGPQHLNGKQALQYVRYRQDALGDITRVGRQQKFLKALLDEVGKKGVLPKLPQLLSEISKTVDTDLSLRQMLRLGLMLRAMDQQGLESDTLPGDFATIDGVSYWLGDREAITDCINTHFGETER